MHAMTLSLLANVSAIVESLAPPRDAATASDAATDTLLPLTDDGSLAPSSSFKRLCTMSPQETVHPGRQNQHWQPEPPQPPQDQLPPPQQHLHSSSRHNIERYSGMEEAATGSADRGNNSTLARNMMSSAAAHHFQDFINPSSEVKAMTTLGILPQDRPRIQECQEEPPFNPTAAGYMNGSFSSSCGTGETIEDLDRQIACLKALRSQRRFELAKLERRVHVDRPFGALREGSRWRDDEGNNIYAGPPRRVSDVGPTNEAEALQFKWRREQQQLQQQQWQRLGASNRQTMLMGPHNMGTDADVLHSNYHSLLELNALQQQQQQQVLMQRQQFLNTQMCRRYSDMSFRAITDTSRTTSPTSSPTVDIEMSREQLPQAKSRKTEGGPTSADPSDGGAKRSLRKGGSSGPPKKRRRLLADATVSSAPRSGHPDGDSVLAPLRDSDVTRVNKLYFLVGRHVLEAVSFSNLYEGVDRSSWTGRERNIRSYRESVTTGLHFVCRFCRANDDAHVRVQSAVFSTQCLRGMYRQFPRFIKNHVQSGKCRSMPDELRQKILGMKKSRCSAGGSEFEACFVANGFRDERSGEKWGVIGHHPELVVPEESR